MWLIFSLCFSYLFTFYLPYNVWFAFFSFICLLYICIFGVGDLGLDKSTLFHPVSFRPVSPTGTIGKQAGDLLCDIGFQKIYVVLMDMKFFLSVLSSVSSNESQKYRNFCSFESFSKNKCSAHGVSIMQNKPAFKDILCFSLILTIPLTWVRDWGLTEIHHLAKYGRPVLCQVKKLHQFQLLCTLHIIWMACKTFITF